MRSSHPTDEGLVAEPSTWSLCWQAAVGRDFFAHARARVPMAHRIRRRLIGAHEQPGRVLIDFVLMPQEIHAVTQLRAGQTVSDVARAFGNVLSRWVREEQPIRSPVLAGPYRAHLLPSVDAVRLELRMLAWRPVMLGMSSTPVHYPNGGLRVAAGFSTGRGFNARPYLDLFDEDVPKAREALRRWIGGRPSQQDSHAWELTRGLDLATVGVGPRAAMAKAIDGPAASLMAAGGTCEMDGALALLSIWCAAKLHLASPETLRLGPTAAAARGRALVACMAVDHRLCSAAAVARYFHRARSTLSEQMTVCRTRSRDRAVIATPLQRIIVETAALQAAVHENRMDR